MIAGMYCVTSKSCAAIRSPLQGSADARRARPRALPWARASAPLWGSGRFVLLIVFALLSLATATIAAEPAKVDYNTHIGPIFKKYCTGCHNKSDREGELVLERYPTLLEGGEHGAVIQPGKSGESRLILVLTGKAKPAMPPEDNEKPTQDEIATLAAWIDAGAKGPAGAEPDPTIIVTPKIKPAGDVHEAISAVAFSPDGKALAVARYGAVELWSLPDRSLM